MHEDRLSNQPTVLIAQSTVDDRLFAIERVQEGIYATCRLGHWVTVDTLERLQTISIDVTSLQKRQRQEQPRLKGGKWWSTAAIDFRPNTRNDPGSISGVERTRGVRLCLQMPQQKSITPAQIAQEISPPVLQDQNGNALKDMVEEAAQGLEEVLKMVRAQYQEALYASKARLPPSTNFGSTTDSSKSRRWHILRKGPCLELEPLSMSIMALPTITRI